MAADHDLDRDTIARSVRKALTMAQGGPADDVAGARWRSWPMKRVTTR